MKIHISKECRNLFFDVAIGLSALYAVERLVTLFVRTMGGQTPRCMHKFNWVMDKIDPTCTLMADIAIVLYLFKRIFNTSFGKQRTLPQDHLLLSQQSHPSVPSVPSDPEMDTS